MRKRGGEPRGDSGVNPDPGGALVRPACLIPAGGMWGGGDGSNFWACGGDELQKGESLDTYQMDSPL